jgi:hypothetical protein
MAHPRLPRERGNGRAFLEHRDGRIHAFLEHGHRHIHAFLEHLEHINGHMLAVF